MSNEDIVRRYCTAVATRDYAAAEALRHRDWVCEWPQSGERVTTSVLEVYGEVLGRVAAVA